MRVALGWQSGAMRPSSHLHSARLYLVRESGARLSGVLKGDDGVPVNMSAAGASLVFSTRLLGADRLTSQTTATKLTGLEGINGNVNTASPYDVAGYGGRFQVLVPPAAFAEAGEYEGELVYFETAIADPVVVYDLVRIFVRDNLYGRPVGAALPSVLLTESGDLLLTESGELLLTE